VVQKKSVKFFTQLPKQLPVETSQCYRFLKNESFCCKLVLNFRYLRIQEDEIALRLLVKNQFARVKQSDTIVDLKDLSPKQIFGVL